MLELKKKLKKNQIDFGIILIVKNVMRIYFFQEPNITQL